MNNEQLITYFQEVVEEIFNGVINAKDLLNDRNKNTLLQSIIDALNELGIAVETVIPQEIAKEYFKAVDEATKLLNQEGISTTDGLALTASGQVASGFKRRIHLEAIEQIVDDTLIDLQAAIRTAKLSAQSNIEETLEAVKSDIAKGMIQGDPRKVVTKRVAQSFLKDGMTSFVTKDGKKLPLDFYSSLVVRTKTRETNTIGHSNRYIESGQGLVKIIERHDTCHVCAKYRGLVVSLTGEHEGYPSKDDVPLPPYHPNCRGNISVWVADFKEESEIQAEKNKWQNWKEDADPRTPAQRREYEKSQEIRRKANEEKKQWMRWNSLLGAENYKTLGAFRRAKRSNSPRFQELQSMYRSAVHSKE